MKDLLQARPIPLTPLKGGADSTKSKGSKKNSDKYKQTFFRTALKTNYLLLESVDRKANILVSVNAIVLSIILGTSFTNGIVFGLASIHVFSMALFSVASILFALRAIKPFVIDPAKLGMEQNSMLNIEAMKHTDINAYKVRLQSVIKREKSVYNSLTEEIFYVGQNVNAKHKYIQYSVYHFVAGIILSLLLMAL